MRPEKYRRNQLLRQFKQDQIAAARRKMCLLPDQLRSLQDYLEVHFFGLGIACDHTLGRTTTWTEKEGLNVEAVLESVREFGGFCDCEVYHNVRPHVFGWDDDAPAEANGEQTPRSEARRIGMMGLCPAPTKPSRSSRNAG